MTSDRDPVPRPGDDRWAGDAPMRALVGPFDRAEHFAYMRGAFDDLDAISFGAHPDADRVVEPGTDIRSILGQVPEGWSPDLILWWRPEYSIWPRGLRELPIPVVMLTSDWYVMWSRVLAATAQADLVVTGSRGLPVFRAAGVPDVVAMPMLGYEPGVDGAATSPERDVDVLCAGSQDWRVHTERGRVLDTLMDLPSSVNFVHPPMVDRPTYARWLSRARIFVNQTVIGEINMKVYEAPAAGACLFVERDNLDVPNELVDGESVVLYDRSDLVEKVLHLLAHEDERRAIAEAGRVAMAGRTYRANVRAIVDAVRARGRQALLATRTTRPRGDHADRAWAAHAILTAGGTGTSILRRVEDLLPEGAARDETLRAVAGYAEADPDPGRGPDALREILARLQRAAPEDASDPYLESAAGVIAMTAGDVPGSIAHFDRAIEVLAADTPLDDPGSIAWMLEKLTVFHLERSTWEALERGESADATMRRLVRAACHALRARLFARAGRPDDAIADLRRAVELDPEGGGVRPALARHLAARGDARGSLDVLDDHLRRFPLEHEVALERVVALIRAGRVDRAREAAVRLQRSLRVFDRHDLDPFLERLAPVLGRAPSGEGGSPLAPVRGPV